MQPECTLSIQENLWNILEPRLKINSNPKHARFLSGLSDLEYEKAYLELRIKIEKDYNCDTFEIDMYERNKAFLGPKTSDSPPRTAQPEQTREDWDRYFEEQAKKVKDDIKKTKEGKNKKPRRGRPPKRKTEDSSDEDK